MVVAPSNVVVDSHWYRSSGIRPDTGIMLGEGLMDGLM
jgi:hypothetical protein